MLFNTYFGQTRQVKQLDGTSSDARPVMTHRHYRPKREVMLRDAETGQTIRYRANAFGVVEVDLPSHVEDMFALGWPLYVGDQARNVRPGDLLFIVVQTPDGSYIRAPLTDAQHIAFRDFVFNSYYADALALRSHGRLTKAKINELLSIMDAVSAGFGLTADDIAIFHNLYPLTGQEV